jgi:leader peptidase (prepilin peptidase)/N-methyltransferase
MVGTLPHRRWIAACVLAVVAAVAVGPTASLGPLLYWAAVTPALVEIDVMQRRLPNAVVVPGIVVAVAGACLHGVGEGMPPAAVVGALGYGGLLFLLALGGGMGMGDVKLAAGLGLAAGLVSPLAAVVAAASPFLLGAGTAVAALRRGRTATVPFGPAMLAGFWVAVLLG